MSADCGLIILGNSGVGKSFLANILLESETFSHKFAPGAVTTKTEQAETSFGEHTFAIFNIPGLIEADQTQIDRNKEEIDKAFLQQPNSLILFVFGEQGGRIRNEDVVAFQAINKAYQFKMESLVIIFNNLPKDRDSDYEGAVITCLRDTLKLNFDKICFLDRINKSSSTEREGLRKTILGTIVKLKPKVHRKQQEIELQISMVKQLKEHIKQLNDQFEAYRAEHREEIHRQQVQYAAQHIIQLMQISLLEDQIRTFIDDSSVS
jgi:hypothetical protein